MPLEYQVHIILGNPGATTWDYEIFSGDNLLQELENPWELIFTEPVPEVVEFRPADWPEENIFFLANHRGVLAL